MAINYNDFTNLFSLQKTLRFELKPVGKTLENIKIAEILEHDEDLADKYEIVKKIIDRFHRKHIDEALSLADLKENISLLKKYKEIYFKNNKDVEDKNEFNEIEKKLRRIVVDVLQGKTKHNNSQKIKDRYTILFNKELFDDKDFLSLVQNQEEMEALKAFKGFTTHFKGFQENRKNMYSEEKESTAIAYRLINENLPIFITNIIRFEKVINEIDKPDIQTIEKELKEELDNNKLKDIFTIEYFQNILTQNGITKYNTIIGGKTKADGTKVQGLNEYINLFNQRSKDKKLPFLKPLYKQILSEENTASFIITAFEKDNEVLQSILEFWKKYIIEAKDSISGQKYNLLSKIKSLLQNLDKLNDSKLEEIYFDNKNIATISNDVYGQWNLIRDALLNYYNSINEMNNKKDYYSWKEIKDAIVYYKQSTDEYKDIDEKAFLVYFKEMNVKDEEDNTIKNLFNLIEERYKKAEPILHEDRKDRNDLHQDKQKVAIIKEFLDSLKLLQNNIKLLYVDADLDNMNYDFYNKLSNYYETLRALNLLYNKVRNYMTRKPFSEEKFALTFNSPTLLDGWDLNKEKSNLGIILRKDNKYYLGIMNKDDNTIFEAYNDEPVTDYYEKMVYKLLPGPNKMLPKVFFSTKGLEYYKPSKDVLDLYKKGEFKKGESFNKKSLHKLIDFYKQAISKNEDWSVFEFKFKNTNDYDDISQFYNDVEKQGYKIFFNKISTSYINQLIENGKLYLFQIYSKDFSEYTKGNPNLHTTYFKNIFSEGNLNNVVYKLNGEAEVFYRKKSIEYTEEIKKKGHHYEELKGKFNYPIIKDKRYAEDKFLFHVPITLNFKAKSKTDVNAMVREYLASTKEKIHIIGIDRGERNLLYLSLIDLNGNIKLQQSLNVIDVKKPNKGIELIDFHQKLDEKEKKLDEARRNWDVIENIKELKEGYLSQVIHKIVKLMVEYNAILVMEDLNFGFKRGRFKVEKQVYQKFEKMLIDKLNYLVFKDKNFDDPGGSLRAYQLSAPFNSFERLGKQCGMIFYVPAQYTSKIDPTTGFYNFLNIDVSNLAKAKETFAKFDKIVYNKNEDYFEFHCKMINFELWNQSIRKSTKNVTAKFKELQWIICSTHHDRYKVERKNNNVNFRKVNVNEELKKLFSSKGIDYEKSTDIKSEILNIEESKFFKELGDLLKILVSLRYNNGKKGSEEKDFILSPVKNATGKFFCTLDNDNTLPIDADANGAYNIALKGLMIVQRAKMQEKLNLSISKDDWINFLIMNKRLSS
ncbi:MAG: type V CRISPR-associated protein Cas12a/Cpf1 [Spirochaetota bacterium]